MIQGQALGELAVFGPIGRTDQAVELLLPGLPLEPALRSMAKR